MGLFSKILDKLGLNKKADDAAQAEAMARMAKKEADARAKIKAEADKAAASAVKPAVIARPGTVVAGGEREFGSTNVPAPAPTPVSEVDVVKKLETLASGSGLDWKVSIVDLLKLLDIDSSREARNELATELGCPPEFMKDSAKMNTWLHKAVLREIAKNGGNIPAKLLD